MNRLTLGGAVLANAEPTPLRLVRWPSLLVCVRLHRLADTFKSGELSYTALAMER